MFKAAIFDLDGTLLNALGDIEEACNYALVQNNLPVIETEKYKAVLGKGRKKIIESIIPNEHKNEKKINEILSNFNSYYETHMMNKTKPYEGIIELLDDLNKNNIITAIVSNKPHEYTKIIVNHYFGNRVKIVFGQRAGFDIKPNPDTLLEVINILNLAKNECIFIGDTEIDLMTAKNANIKSIGVLWGYRSLQKLESEGADYIVSTTDELKNIIING